MATLQHPRGFTARNVALIGLLIAMAVLVRADQVVPVSVRVPGFLVLAAVMLWLLLGPPKRRAPRAH